MPRTRIQFELHSPFRRPEWRSDRVMRVLANVAADVDRGKALKLSASDDEFTRKLRNYRLRQLRGNANVRRSLDGEMPEVAWACRIYDNRSDPVDGRKAAILESRILAGQTDAEIGSELAAPPEVPMFYEKVFFDVRNRIKAHDWIVEMVLAPAFENSMQVGGRGAFDERNGPRVALPYFDATLRSFAYFGGPMVLDFALSGFRRDAKVRQREQTGHWYDETMINRIRHRSASAVHGFEVNKYNVMELFAIHAKLIEVIREKDDQHKTQGSLHTAVTAMLNTMIPETGKPIDLVEMEREAKKSNIDFQHDVVEPRDSELNDLVSGKPVASFDHARNMKLPPPRAKLQESPSVDAK